MIELTHIQKVVAQATVLSIESLKVEPGQTVGILGMTGQAKTLLWQLLSGRVPPTAGTVRLAGLDPVHHWDQLTRQVGLLPVENSLYPRLTARQNLAFFANLYGLNRGRVDQVLHQVGLTDRADERAESLSPGLARRLAFGRTILHQPSILILAEPLAECDASSVEVLLRLMGELAAAAILIITAESTGLRALCQTFYVLEQGSLVREMLPQTQTQDAHVPFKIPARLEGKVTLINAGDILYAATDESKTVLYTKNGPIPTHLTMSEVEERLARQGFFRAHRTHLVNLQHVKEVIAYTRNSFTIVLDDATATEIPLSKTAARDLRDLLDY
ncbi:MAG: LytTR family transcriptional regulator DNA-binding domain-containing protein [Chloroflexi bacterium]|nr:LytTR family transcriptional regulator DNA-binding domain-containing protein [Chloroflexota bacterium]